MKDAIRIISAFLLAAATLWGPLFGQAPLSPSTPGSSVLVLFGEWFGDAIAREQSGKESPRPLLSGSFLGQRPPGMTPEIFAPGIVSKEGDQGRLFIALDGSEIIYWERESSGRMRIIGILKKNGVWSEREVLPFSEEYINNEPCLSPDGQKLFFVSNRPRSGTGAAEKFPDIWMVEKVRGRWGEPRNLGEPVNRLDIAVQPYMAGDGKLYFGGMAADRSVRGLFVSQYDGRIFSEPEMLDAAIFGEASGPCVSPDGRVLVVHARKDGGFGDWDLYASHRDAAGNWGPLVNLGSAVNTEAAEAGASFSPDGKFLFFSRHGDIFWVSADVAGLVKAQLEAEKSEPMGKRGHDGFGQFRSRRGITAGPAAPLANER